MPTPPQIDYKATSEALRYSFPQKKHRTSNDSYVELYYLECDEAGLGIVLEQGSQEAFLYARYDDAEEMYALIVEEAHAMGVCDDECGELEREKDE